MKLIRLSLLCLLTASVFTSCVKKSYDNPPDTSSVDPMLPVTASLQQLSYSALSLPISGSRILGDTTLYGIVIGDDRSGNIYKQIVIEDSTRSGITVLLDKTYLYGDYPVGRKVYIKTKGLYLANYKGLPELAFSVDSVGNTTGIPSSMIGNYVVKGSFPHTVTPDTVELTDLYSNPTQYMNTLIQLNDMQFDNSSAGTTYSLVSQSVNRTIIDCAHTGQVVMYNSSYADFQPAITPTGNGYIVAISSIYLSTPQLVLRDTTDVHFTGARCP